MGIEMRRGLLGLMAIGNEATEQMHEEIERTAVARVLNLADVLELIDITRLEVFRLSRTGYCWRTPKQDIQDILAGVDGCHDVK